MRQGFDIVVIGAGVGGLAAATLLARRGRHVLLLEGQAVMPQPAGALFALDPQIVNRLRLVRHGLRFARSDLALTGWDDEDPPLVLGRDRRAAARAIAAISRNDAQAWGPFQARLQHGARALRRWWWQPRSRGHAVAVLRGRAARAGLARDSVMGAEDFLAQHFESPRLIGLLLADAVAGGFGPCEPGSALALFWRAAQEMNDLQGASAVAEPGTLIASLASAARAAGVMTRMAAPVAAIQVRQGEAAGVVLQSGEEIRARAVLSSLPRGASEALAGLEHPDALGAVGAAQIFLKLDAGMTLPAALTGSRVALTPPPQGYGDAYEAARAGVLPACLPMICVADAPRRLVLSLPLAPVFPVGGWRDFQAPLAALAVKLLSRHIPGLARGIAGVAVLPPPRLARPTLAQLLAPAAIRAATRLPGLYLCGDSAEPMACVCGRAGRFAAKFVARHFS